MNVYFFILTQKDRHYTAIKIHTAAAAAPSADGERNERARELKERRGGVVAEEEGYSK